MTYRDYKAAMTHRSEVLNIENRKDLRALQKPQGIDAIYEDIGIQRKEAIKIVKHIYNSSEKAYADPKMEKYKGNIRTEV